VIPLLGLAMVCWQSCKQGSKTGILTDIAISGYLCVFVDVTVAIVDPENPPEHGLLTDIGRQ
jgi:hypothetical protein